ncbi:MAG: hypothetical protein AAFQ57_10790, partial [Cyanobacteria bacterium J06626_14]
MHDNKVRLSQDVIDKAEIIASEWGLKNARAAVEAVFRKYSDEYLHGRLSPTNVVATQAIAFSPKPSPARHSNCEAMDVL